MRAEATGRQGRSKRRATVEMDEKTTKTGTVMETLLGTIGFGLALIGSWLL